MGQHQSVTLVVLIVLLAAISSAVLGQTYDNTADIFNDLLVNSGYNTQIRPLLDQSKIIKVTVGFEIVSIVEVNDVEQSFVCNGFMSFSWTDEKLRWNVSSYGGQANIHPIPETIWRPRVLLMNTLGSRDLFGDDKAPITVLNNGKVFWIPGGLFPASCELNMANYPFDQQICIIKMASMSLSYEELQFQTLGLQVLQSFYTINGEWDLTNGFIKIVNTTGGTSGLSSAQITFVLKRRPHFFLINILLPIVFLSFLNILVFMIPADSGEKIGYGITVLLALSVFLSTVSSMIPRSSLTIPKVTIYVFILLIISVLTVIEDIVIVYLHHMEEQEEIHQKARANFRSAFTKVKHLQRAVSPLGSTSNLSKKMTSSAADLNAVSSDVSSDHVSGRVSTKDIKGLTSSKMKTNKYKIIGKHIDKFSFLFFLVLWLAVTIGFLVSMSQS